MPQPVLLLLGIILVIIIIYWYSKQNKTGTMLVKQSSEIDPPYPKLSQMKPEPEPLSADTSVDDVVPVANNYIQNHQSFPKFVSRKNGSRSYSDIPIPKYSTKLVQNPNNYRDIPNPIYY
jgi:hypothetical protein